jgi:pimeloyl-ACP methyl ester carboxylesterase
MTTRETARTQFLEANVISFGYRLIGDPNTTKPPCHKATLAPPKPLPFQHRSLGPDYRQRHRRIWRPVIYYDYAGMGQSSGDVRLLIKELSADVIAFLAALLPSLPGSPTEFDILAFSMRGYVAQQVVLDNPDLVRKMIISGSGPSGSTGTLADLLSRPMGEVQSAIITNPAQAQPILDSFFLTFIDTKDAGNAWLGRIMSARAALAGQEGEQSSRASCWAHHRTG